MTARDVLTFKYLGSDYQHKKHFLKEKINMLGEKWLPNELDFARKIQVQRKKKYLNGDLSLILFFFFFSDLCTSIVIINVKNSSAFRPMFPHIQFHMGRLTSQN